MVWILLAQDRDQRQAVVKTVTNHIGFHGEEFNSAPWMDGAKIWEWIERSK